MAWVRQGDPQTTNYCHEQAKPACLLAPKELFFWHQTDFIFGLRTLKNIGKGLQQNFPTCFWVWPNFKTKKPTLLLPYTPSEPISGPLSCQTPNWATFQILLQNLIGVICNPSSWVWVVVSLQAMNNDTLPQIYLEWKFLYTYLCHNWQYFCNHLAWQGLSNAIIT